MSIYSLYQGYPSNKNQFFAPSISKRQKTPQLRNQRNPALVSPEFLDRMVTPVPLDRKKLYSYKHDVTYKQHKKSLTSEMEYSPYLTSSSNLPPLAKIRTVSNSPSITPEKININKTKFYKPSCDVGVQNVSIESFTGIFTNKFGFL
jgi:hypothetical protein